MHRSQFRSVRLAEVPADGGITTVELDDGKIVQHRPGRSFANSMRIYSDGLESEKRWKTPRLDRAEASEDTWLGRHSEYDS